jgi:hypothetical protein
MGSLAPESSDVAYFRSTRGSQPGNSPINQEGLRYGGLQDTVDAMGGTIFSGGFYNFSFSIDVPETITEFTVRQWPTVAPVRPPGERELTGVQWCLSRDPSPRG